jgi:hypothetical protein
MAISGDHQLAIDDLARHEAGTLERSDFLILSMCT